jgi:two-component system cell cycle response regulator DivK
VAALSSLATRILLVDDTEDARELYAEYLESRGYDVSQAADGQQALHAAFAQLPAVIIMDLDMPVMDGWTAIRVLKGDARTRHVPIIVVSGNVMPDQVRAAREAGATAVLEKPCAPGALGIAIAHALRGEAVPAGLCSNAPE